VERAVAGVDSEIATVHSLCQAARLSPLRLKPVYFGFHSAECLGGVGLFVVVAVFGPSPVVAFRGLSYFVGGGFYVGKYRSGAVIS